MQSGRYVLVVTAFRTSQHNPRPASACAVLRRPAKPFSSERSSSLNTKGSNRRLAIDCSIAVYRHCIATAMRIYCESNVANF